MHYANVVRQKLAMAASGKDVTTFGTDDEVKYEIEDAERDVEELRKIRRQIRCLFGPQISSGGPQLGNFNPGNVQQGINEDMLSPEKGTNGSEYIEGAHQAAFARPPPSATSSMTSPNPAPFHVPLYQQQALHNQIYNGNAANSKNSASQSSGYAPYSQQQQVAGPGSYINS